MSPRAASRSSTAPPEVSALSALQLAQLVCTQSATIDSLQQQVDGLEHQLACVNRQIVGWQIERYTPEPDPIQRPLAAVTTAIDPSQPQPRQNVITHTRRVRTHDPVNDAESLPFFDETRLPVHTIEVLDPE